MNDVDIISVFENLFPNVNGEWNGDSKYSKNNEFQTI